MYRLFLQSIERGFNLFRRHVSLSSGFISSENRLRVVVMYVEQKVTYGRNIVPELCRVKVVDSRFARVRLFKFEEMCPRVILVMCRLLIL